MNRRQKKKLKKKKEILECKKFFKALHDYYHWATGLYKLPEQLDLLATYAALSKKKKKETKKRMMRNLLKQSNELVYLITDPSGKEVLKGYRCSISDNPILKELEETKQIGRGLVGCYYWENGKGVIMTPKEKTNVKLQITEISKHTSNFDFEEEFEEV